MRMRRHFKYLFIIMFLPTLLWAKKTPKYPVADIPAELLKNADAVIRDKSTVLEIVSDSKIIFEEKYVITVLKESGVDKALFRRGYDKLSGISNIEAVIYDGEGKKIKTISNDEIKDFTSISGFSLYEDNRVKLIDPMQSEYPFTVEYSYAKKYNSAYYVRGWDAFYGYNTAVEKHNFKIVYPLDYDIHYKEFHLKAPGKKEEVDGKYELSWSLSNWKAPVKEYFSDYNETWVPGVKIAPSSFKLEGYSGNLNSWEDFGRFTYSLNQGKDFIPEETLKKVEGLLNEQMDDYQKISTIYNYSQGKNRYISIQVGIGGLQPFEAETVDRLSYGDCKALSNYTVSLLRHFGYDAYYTLVHAGEQTYEDKSFVSDYFNHIIACVPLQNDTIWLECTNSYVPCGYLGDFTDDRYVLLVKESGGELVRTPKFSANENNQSTNAKVLVGADGSAEVDVTLTYKGGLFGDQLSLVQMDETDRRKKIIKSIDLPHFELKEYNVVAHSARKPSFDKELKLTMPKYASHVGSRMFVPLNPMNKSDWIPPYSRSRKTPMMISRDYSENDTLVYQIPEGFKLEALPKAVELNSEFGVYQSSSKFEGGSILYHRELVINKGHYPKEKYNEFVEFLEKIAKHDEAKAVLVKGS
ncbi:DUF3857 domain-containing protein [Labilibacter sediminis]|nr:DUF3857 domain-containing protein [Labilibacter sediminis]